MGGGYKNIPSRSLALQLAWASELLSGDYRVSMEGIHGLKVKRKLGTDGHLKKALTSHISYNSLRVGSPNRVMTLRKSKPTQSPLQN